MEINNILSFLLNIIDCFDFHMYFPIQIMLILKIKIVLYNHKIYIRSINLII
jgi:hypothetical protein